jgi:6-phosphogluconolactonase/glucosamine-6-phosphate isomerase/deaminase
MAGLAVDAIRQQKLGLVKYLKKQMKKEERDLPRSHQHYEEQMSVTTEIQIQRHIVGDNVWLTRRDDDDLARLASLPVHAINYEVLESENDVGRAMLQELEQAARAKSGDLTIILLGGRGAQELHRLLGELAKTTEADQLLNRLHVFTQDALAPMRMNNSFSFVRDFERLLGEDFFKKVKSFNSMRTDRNDLEGELVSYLAALESSGGVDIFFLGLGPEAGAASHLAYIKPGSGAGATDLAGVIPVSSSIIEHHITKFKAGGSAVTAADEAECRNASHILTLGPAAILNAKRIVQSIVDADTAPAKPVSFRRLIETEIAADPETRRRQLDENPGLWIRLHPNVRSLILPNVLL